MSIATARARVEKLETCAGITAPGAWHRIIVDTGETEDEAKARYQAEHGPVGPNDNWIVWTIIN